MLDVGSGTGAFLHEMKRNGWKVTGLEPNAEARNDGQGNLYTTGALEDTADYIIYLQTILRRLHCGMYWSMSMTWQSMFSRLKKVIASQRKTIYCRTQLYPLDALFTKNIGQLSYTEAFISFFARVNGSINGKTWIESSAIYTNVV